MAMMGRRVKVGSRGEREGERERRKRRRQS